MSSFILDYYNYRIVAQYYDAFIRGLGNTIWAASISLVLSLILGTILAILLFSKWAVLRQLIHGYITFIRGTPLLVQIYLVYFGLPVLFPFTLKWPEMSLGIAALVLNCAPYMCEIIRTGIESVARGQVEAAKAVGMSYGQRLRHIVLPQAFANVIPPVIGQTAVLIKDTSLLSLITVFELTSAGILLNSERVRPNEGFLTIAVAYLAIYLLVLLLSHAVKQKLAGPAWNVKG
ncbi:amino acid ABC transporter permease [Falsochrobactrum shanghaiense]|uniref:Amino acid ABC transporter permease n=1 Tax=Falsochrobactrum shanghaiense TaxID=2201899 RepID=A0A316J4K6_9HYPH|nr:amino acid ABC transporter permease [Falsochrobactrum shanghaiense]PWL16767.1 amino acid ABC transporter permease [Falsochrobactrum shanghaiense]